jgi:hypothetical protein
MLLFIPQKKPEFFLTKIVGYNITANKPALTGIKNFFALLL